MPLRPMGHMDQEACDLIGRLLEKRAIGGGVLATDDCRRTYEELTARGVVFQQEPREMPYGVEALFHDDSGNFYSLTQRKA